MQAGHTEQPVGVDEFIQLPGGGLGVGVAVTASAVSGRRETLECGAHLLIGHLTAGPGSEQTVFVPGMAREQVDVPRGAAGERAPRRVRKQDAVDDG